MGAGFSGIAMAIALRREGIEDFTLFERADDLGGVWHHNTYPGAACDVPSYLYSFSYEQRRDWPQPCSPQAEILDYLHDTARKHGVIDRVRTGTEVERADFDDAPARWTLARRRASALEADALVLACGQLSRPRWPSIPGMDEFGGHSLPLGRVGPRLRPAGKRVAVIGTGASAIQFVPARGRARGARGRLPAQRPVRAAARQLARTRPSCAAPDPARARAPGRAPLRDVGVHGDVRARAHAGPAARRWLLRAWSTAFMRSQLRTPRCAARPGPTTRSAASASCSAPTTCRPPAPRRGARDRRDRADHRHAAWSPRTAASARPTASSTAPASARATS